MQFEAKNKIITMNKNYSNIDKRMDRQIRL